VQALEAGNDKSLLKIRHVPMARDDVAICLHALYPSVAVHPGDHVEAYEEPDYSRDPFQIPYRDCIQNRHKPKRDEHGYTQFADLA
jgi:hypothetical protein